MQLHNKQRLLPVAKRRVNTLLRLAAPPEWADAELSIAIVDAEQMAHVNRTYTGRDTDADVLAFPLADETDAGIDEPMVVGEIVVSASRALAEAETRGIDPQDEMALYLVHGALHLQGYDDHTTAERRRMYAREREILQLAGSGDVRRGRKG